MPTIKKIRVTKKVIEAAVQVHALTHPNAVSEIMLCKCGQWTCSRCDSQHVYEKGCNNIPESLIIEVFAGDSSSNPMIYLMSSDKPTVFDDNTIRDLRWEEEEQEEN